MDWIFSQFYGMGSRKISLGDCNISLGLMDGLDQFLWIMNVNLGFCWTLVDKKLWCFPLNGDIVACQPASPPILHSLGVYDPGLDINTMGSFRHTVDQRLRFFLQRLNAREHPTTCRVSTKGGVLDFATIFHSRISQPSHSRIRDFHIFSFMIRHINTVRKKSEHGPVESLLI